jgi:hypothetical protein
MLLLLFDDRQTQRRGTGAASFAEAASAAIKHNVQMEGNS